MEWALADDKPLLCICRGFQLLNAKLGGSLYQDILTERDGSDDHQLSTHKKSYTHIAHHIKLDSESQLARITNARSLAANTHHHQGIKVLAHDIKASAWAEDGIIEAVEHPGKTFTIGVQCHPESLYMIEKGWAAVFEEFVRVAARGCG